MVTIAALFAFFFIAQPIPACCFPCEIIFDSLGGVWPSAWVERKLFGGAGVSQHFL
jgi:hypothetical protein